MAAAVKAMRTLGSGQVLKVLAAGKGPLDDPGRRATGDELLDLGEDGGVFVLNVRKAATK